MSSDMPSEMWRTLPRYQARVPNFSSPEEPDSTTPVSSPANNDRIPLSQINRGDSPAPGPAIRPSQTAGGIGRLVSATHYDRCQSILNFGVQPDDGAGGGGDLAPFNRAHAKIVNEMNRHLAEIDIRLGFRTVPTVQATVRLERLRQDMADNSFPSEAALAAALAEEYHSVLTRLEALSSHFRACNNKPACCACQFPPPAHAGPAFTVSDHVTGREIQGYIDMHAAQHTTESGTLRAVYGGLGDFFLGILGVFDPSKERCQSRNGFLRAWRAMTQRPEYFNKLDAEIGDVQAVAVARRARGEHAKTSRLRSLSGIFGRKNSVDERPSSSGSRKSRE